MEYYSVNEICQKVGITRQAISRAIKAGRIKAAKIGGQYRIEKKWFDDYMSRGGDLGQQKGVENGK